MKNYEEIAKKVFERKEAYLKKRQKVKRTIVKIVAPSLCFVIVFTTVFGLWRSGIFSNNVIKTPQGDNSGFDEPFDDNSQNSSVDTPSNDGNTSDVIPPITNEERFIDSIDKMNFYSAKQILSKNSLLPISGKYDLNKPAILNLNGFYVEYPIDPNKVFTVTMVTYFTIELNDENGFLAQKLGGTGLVEVVITRSDIDGMDGWGGMITFKRDDKYYSCLTNGAGIDRESNTSNMRFSTHKYIDGFNIVKNTQQENFMFTVNFEGSKVVGFECDTFDTFATVYDVDDVTFVDDFCIVLYTKQYFTINQLEQFVKNEGDVM